MAQGHRTSITDIPRNVQKGERDTFGIEPYENGLTKFINSTSTPITVALQGEWGSGKTSLMNSLQQNLSDSEGAQFHAIWLNTWEYALMKDGATTLIDIISGLIEETSKIANVDQTKTSKLVKKLLRIGKSTAQFAVRTAADKVVTGASNVVDTLFDDANDTSDATIGEIRQELEKIIETCIAKDNKKGFIFFIDDLDRIDPPIAVQLLELLKNIFTIKNCVFVLAIDYDVVVKGLEPKFGKLSAQNEREFRSFFDKIIQVPFSMPLTSYKIDTFLQESLLSIGYINQEQANNNKLISQFSEICQLSVGSNPRGLKRLLNSLSLISCINSTKYSSDDEENQLNDDIELLINLTLVSIQIAYPAVYKLLTLHSGFDNWNENVALQMNLQPLDEQSLEKLSKSEEFDEDWEQVLFRLCENDFYLKKKALNISRLLNKLKVVITEKGEAVEDLLGAIISLSSVTNLEAYDKPVIVYHGGSFLKHISWCIIPILKKKLPHLADLIKPQGKRIQTNAIIKFTVEDWGDWVNFRTKPHDGKIQLNIVTAAFVCPAKANSVHESLKALNKLKEFEEIEQEYTTLFKLNPNIVSKPLLHRAQYNKKKDWFEITLPLTIALPTLDDFYTVEILDEISDAVKKLYETRMRLKKYYAEWED